MQHILIAATGNINRHHLQQILPNEGCFVAICANGNVLMKKIMTGKYDLIISQVVIFENRIDFTIWMIKDPFYSSVPVIFIVSEDSAVAAYSALSKKKMNFSLLNKSYLPRQLNNLARMFLAAKSKHSGI